ncbi:MAG: hypothetical protein H6608_08285 [Flavobacteriales bacterium]|nr:hypothetical protein [Bacteroidota bacterium]MCB9241115.1 hypothetical protein [Flavobacteriales bacterium]
MNKLDKLWIGIVTGLVAPLILLIIIFRFTNFMEDFGDTGALFVSIPYTAVILRPTLLINLAIFLFFINRNYMRFSRGMVMSTMLYVIFIAWIFFTQ